MYVYETCKTTSRIQQRTLKKYSMKMRLYFKVRTLNAYMYMKHLQRSGSNLKLVFNKVLKAFNLMFEIFLRPCFLLL